MDRRTWLVPLLGVGLAGCGRFDFEDHCGSRPFGGLYSGGSGSTAAPYEVCTAAELAELATRTEQLDATFVVLTDLDFQGIPFRGLGTPDAPFRGVIDGQGHTFANLELSGVDEPVGFLAVSRFAHLSNLTFKNARLTASGPKSSAGLISADCEGTVVRDVTLKDIDVSGESDVGGVFGYEYNCQLLGASLSGTVTGTSDSVGGIVGMADRGVFLDVDSTVNVPAPLATAVGGAVGLEVDSPVILQNVHVSASVTGDMADGPHETGLMSFEIDVQ